MMRMKPKSQKATLVLTGRGGVVRVDVAGAKPSTPARVRVAVGKGKQGPALAAVTGVEAFDGYVNVSWVATSQLHGLRLNIEVSL